MAVYDSGPLMQLLGATTAFGRWHAMQQRYPQLTKDVKFQALNDRAVKATEGPNFNAYSYGGPGFGIAVNSDIAGRGSSPPMDQLIAKELGQSLVDRFVGTKERGDALTKAWGGTTDPHLHRDYGMIDQGWNGNTDPEHTSNTPWSVQVHDYRSFPGDTYGTEFANALGYNSSDPGSWGRGGIQNESVLQRLMAAGILPRGDQAAQNNRARLGEMKNSLLASKESMGTLLANVPQNAAVLASKNRMGQLLDRISAFAQPQMNLGSAAQATPAQPTRVAAVQNLMSKFGF